MPNPNRPGQPNIPIPDRGPRPFNPNFQADEYDALVKRLNFTPHDLAVANGNRVTQSVQSRRSGKEPEKTEDDWIKDINDAVTELRRVAKPEVNIDVLDEASVATRGLKSVLQLTGRRPSRRAPFTVTEYMDGHHDHTTSRKQWKVGSTTSGWMFPRPIMTPASYPGSKPIISTDARVGAAMPTGKVANNLVLSVDGKWWDQGHIAKPTAGEPVTVGVLSTNPDAGNVLKRYDAKTLKAIHMALQYAIEAPLFPTEHYQPPKKDDKTGQQTPTGNGSKTQQPTSKNQGGRPRRPSRPLPPLPPAHQKRFL